MLWQEFGSYIKKQPELLLLNVKGDTSSLG